VERELPAAEEVVRLCDGLPIAIRAAGEKLAAWPARSLSEFAGRLSDERRRLTELGGPHLDVRGRLRGTRTRLPERERQALRMLCRGPAPVRGLSALESGLGLGRTEAEHLVESLASCHLLETATGPDGDVRFWVPPMLRLAFADTVESPPAAGAWSHPSVSSPPAAVPVPPVPPVPSARLVAAPSGTRVLTRGDDTGSR
jgi:hypothetical protein